MKYLVTGSKGFIGAHLVKSLEKLGHSVSTLDIKDGSGDVRNIDDVLTKAKDVDCIFHLAAVASVQESIINPQYTYQTNVIGTRTVFEAAKILGSVSVVYASSAAVYGDNQNLPLNESEPPRPLSPYAEHKMQNEEDAKLSGLPTFGLRFFNVYGPGQDPSSPYSGVISIFYQRLLAQQNLVIYGDGRQTRDFVAVHDVVESLLKAMNYTSSLAPVANVCTGQRTNLQDLIGVLGGHLKLNPKIYYDDTRVGDIRHSLGNPSLFEKITGFKPSTPILEGLKRLIEEAA